MLRRKFLQRLALLAGSMELAAVAPSAQAQPQSPQSPRGARKILQTSPLAGFQYHQGEQLWAQLAIGQRLQLVREPDNRHDERAVRVDWHGHKLGYIPRLDNAAVIATAGSRRALGSGNCATGGKQQPLGTDQTGGGMGDVAFAISNAGGKCK